MSADPSDKLQWGHDKIVMEVTLSLYNSIIHRFASMGP